MPVASVITAGTAIAGLLLEGAGLIAQSAEEKEAFQEFKAESARERALGRRQFQQAIKEKRRAISAQKQEAERAWKWKEEERDYQRKNDMIDRILGTMNRDANFRQNLIAMRRG